MGKKCWILLLLLIPVGGVGQIYVSGGYNQSVTFLENGNWVVDKFNEQGFLPRRMRKLVIPRGEFISAGYFADAFFAEASWTGRRDRVRALTSNGYQRDLKMGINSLGISGGINFLNTDEMAISIGTGAAASFFTASTRLGPEQNINRTNFFLIRRQIGLSGDYFVQFFLKPTTGHKLGFIVRPYFQYRYFDKFDWYRVHTSVNDLNFLEPFGVYEDRGNSFGLILTLVFSPTGFGL